MNPIFPDLPHTLGVYTLTRLLEQRPGSELYEGRQTHVDRAVVLEVLQPRLKHHHEAAFLAQARRRVSISGIPHVADVFESLRAEGLWFLTQELPPGRALADVTTTGETLSVLHICRIIAAAAEMYHVYREKGLSAMPLAASSIFIENNGEVHFLSPLVEGETIDTAEQMQALAAALWPLCPQVKTTGLGRVVTMLQWLSDGVDARYLTWDELGATARTVVEQLLTNALPENAKPLRRRASEFIARQPAVQKTRHFLVQWGMPIAMGLGIVAVMTYMGTLFGMAAPETVPAGNDSAFLCQQAGKNELVMRLPVSVQQYADYMQSFSNLPDDQRREILRDCPLSADKLAPANWETQCKIGNPQAPVTGVTYWQALAYARYAGGQLPTAGQIQTALAAGATPAALEWSRDTAESPLPGVYNGTTHLLVNKLGKIRPAHDRNWQSAHCAFRISLPDNH